MRWLKASLFVLVVTLLQMVLLSRLNIFGAVPDLGLVAVIIYAIYDERLPATIFAAGTGWLQDCLAFGAYLNMIVKVGVALGVNLVKESFIGDEYLLSLVLVLVFSLLVGIVTRFIIPFYYGRPLDLPGLVFNLSLSTLYNLLFVPLLTPIIKEFSHD